MAIILDQNKSALFAVVAFIIHITVSTNRWGMSSSTAAGHPAAGHLGMFDVLAGESAWSDERNGGTLAEQRWKAGLQLHGLRTVLRRVSRGEVWTDLHGPIWYRRGPIWDLKETFLGTLVNQWCPSRYQCCCLALMPLNFNAAGYKCNWNDAVWPPKCAVQSSTDSSKICMSGKCANDACW